MKISTLSEIIHLILILTKSPIDFIVLPFKLCYLLFISSFDIYFVFIIEKYISPTLLLAIGNLLEKMLFYPSIFFPVFCFCFFLLEYRQFS